jgi:hypothetical protein
MLRRGRREDIENRILAILPADLNPLVDPADSDVHALVDAVRGVDGDLFGSHLLPVSPKDEKQAHHNHQEPHQAQQDNFRDLQDSTHGSFIRRLRHGRTGGARDRLPGDASRMTKLGFIAQRMPVI